MKFQALRNSVCENFPFPSPNELVYETPPTVIWVADGSADYRLRICRADGVCVFEAQTERFYATPDQALAAGEYRYTVEGANGTICEDVPFTIAENALHFDRPDADDVLANLPNERPRYLFCASDIAELVQTHPLELRVLKNNVNAAIAHGLPVHTRHHHEELAHTFRDYFAEFRLFCDRDLIACALFYALTGDEEAGRHGRELLFAICDMNPLGPNAIDDKWDDEIGISCIRCLPPAFDLLYDLFAPRERRFLAQTIAVYARQCVHKLQNYEKYPADSHTGRVPAYLGGAALVLWGEGVEEEKTLRDWLALALRIYCGVFPFFGGNDGSWAEGAFYSTSYTKWYLPFFVAVERFSGKSLFNRPFYHRYSHFLLHFCNPSYELHPFGDGYWCHSDSPEWPGFFAQNPYRVYAERFGPELARERMRACADTDLYYLHLLDLFLPTPKNAGSPLAEEPSDLAVFPDGGFVAMHTDLWSKDDICVLARASRFSYDGHRHADQGSFALFARGVALIAPSGYYGRGWGSAHHKGWTKQTKAHNALLFDGIGQNAVDPRLAVGEIVEHSAQHRTCLLDMSAAYPNVKKWQRKLTLLGDTLTVCDTVGADEAVEVTYPLHTLSAPTACTDGFCLERNGVQLRVTVQEGDLQLFDMRDCFDTPVNEGVPAGFEMQMPPQYHVYFRTPKKKEHRITVNFKISYLEK